MNDILKYVGSFAAGVACGALVGTLLAKKKYRSEYEKAAESVAEYVNARKDIDPVDEAIDMPDPEDVFEAIKEEDTSLKDELNRLAAKYRSGIDAAIEDLSTPKNDIPYLIEPEMFGEDLEYEQISLTYYADGKLADSDDDLVENIADVVGKEWRERFDKYDEDIVYVCNDARKCYYEITRDYRKYMEILEERPYLIHNVFDVPQDEGE